MAVTTPHWFVLWYRGCTGQFSSSRALCVVLQITAVPPVTAPHVDPSAPSAVLDAAVRAEAAGGGPVYHLEGAQMKALQPSVVITQSQCRICAVTEHDVQMACADVWNGARVITVAPATLEDVYGDVRAIAEALGVPERGRVLEALLRSRMGAIGAVISPLTRPGLPPPTVAHVEWLAPLMGSGYWIAESVAAARGRLILGAVGGTSPSISMADLSAADHIVIAPCGFDIDRTAQELQDLAWESAEGWRDLPAVQKGHVYVADGNKHFNRSSTAVVETAEMVAEMLWSPGLFGHHGERWVRLAELPAYAQRHPPKPAMVPSGREAPVPSHRAKAVDRPPHARETSPEELVEHQVKALQQGDMEQAFALNTVANQERLGSPDAFGRIVRGGFPALLDAGAEFRVTLLEPNESAKIATVQVDLIRSPAGAVMPTLLFNVRHEADFLWRTDGVRTGVCGS